MGILQQPYNTFQKDVNSILQMEKLRLRLLGYFVKVN